MENFDSLFSIVELLSKNELILTHGCAALGKIQSESGVFLDFQRQKSYVPISALNLKNI